VEQDYGGGPNNETFRVKSTGSPRRLGVSSYKNSSEFFANE
jgi:hypothetical protein